MSDYTHWTEVTEHGDWHATLPQYQNAVYHFATEAEALAFLDEMRARLGDVA